MQIQIMTKNEPFQPSDILIAKEGLMVQVPVEHLEQALDRKLEVHIVKTAENMSMKCAILVDRLASQISDTEPVFIACSDKTILDAVCSLELRDAEGRQLVCVPAGSKPGTKAPAKTSRARSSGAGKSKAARQEPPQEPETPGTPETPDAAGQDPGGPEPGQAAGGPEPGQAPKPGGKDDNGDPGSDPEPRTGGPETPAGGVYDENLGIQLPGVAPGSHEIDLTSPPEPKIPKPGENPAAQVMKILKDLDIPSNQIPGVLEAVREAADASITLPMQVRVKLARDKATDGMTAEAIAEKLAPEFDRLQQLMKQAQAQ